MDAVQILQLKQQKAVGGNGGVGVGTSFTALCAIKS